MKKKRNTPQKIARRDEKERGKTNQNEKELDEPRKNVTRNDKQDTTRENRTKRERMGHSAKERDITRNSGNY